MYLESSCWKDSGVENTNHNCHTMYSALLVRCHYVSHKCQEYKGEIMPPLLLSWKKWLNLFKIVIKFLLSPDILTIMSFYWLPSARLLLWITFAFTQKCVWTKSLLNNIIQISRLFKQKEMHTEMLLNNPCFLKQSSGDWKDQTGTY